ncbi:uncharacterized protein CC84DRAFT_479017 [Paraphaeosphaeria sporulosa]|uniref:Uncharacterized protein n=1 Tax=Paraphaeosphaeria sporulosa TaxID=1460663 RepID=A0A177CU82_9PLEO|nr:uncharacterized protein CC84DRAFT_479017 [Paraphaeosphaeria sporulosa]OAG10319.1 hypothetical protein CC84DRAFT_479017 [Paraphaeosphaeria sporulosa]
MLTDSPYKIIPNCLPTSQHQRARTILAHRERCSDLPSGTMGTNKESLTTIRFPGMEHDVFIEVGALVWAGEKYVHVNSCGLTAPQKRESSREIDGASGTLGPAMWATFESGKTELVLEEARPAPLQAKEVVGEATPMVMEMLQVGAPLQEQAMELTAHPKRLIVREKKLHEFSELKRRDEAVEQEGGGPQIKVKAMKKLSKALEAQQRMTGEHQKSQPGNWQLVRELHDAHPEECQLDLCPVCREGARPNHTHQAVRLTKAAIESLSRVRSFTDSFETEAESESTTESSMLETPPWKDSSQAKQRDPDPAACSGLQWGHSRLHSSSPAAKAAVSDHKDRRRTPFST